MRLPPLQKSSGLRKQKQDNQKSKTFDCNIKSSTQFLFKFWKFWECGGESIIVVNSGTVLVQIFYPN